MKDKLPLIIGIALPLALILFVLVTSYLPSLYIKPGYNFIYVSRNYDYDVRVLDGKISASPKYIYNLNNLANQPIIYLYDVVQNKSSQISLASAQRYNLDSSNKSPDGFTIDDNNSSYSFFPFFWENSDRGVYLKGKGLSKKVDIDQYYDFQFVGWILK